ncbi:MAG TPA: putative 2OG-Fe(II) oxygenase [Sphingomonas sp.]
MIADPAALEDLARTALETGDEEAVLKRLEPAAVALNTPRLWQWVGLLQRSLDRHEAAIDAFARAARLAPGDASIAHGRAHVALEAGLPAVALFEAAWRLNPGSGEILTGLTSARFAAGEGDAAADQLALVVKNNPGWIDGHRALAQVRALLSGKAAAGQSFAEAVTARSDQLALWEAWIAMLVAGELYDEALDVVRRARRRSGASRWLDLQEAIALSEQGEVELAEPLFSAIDDPAATIWRVRHLLRSGRIVEALPLIDAGLDPADPALWPYAAIAWRLAGDPRWEWLDGQPGLVSVIDLTGDLPPLDRLADILRGLHLARAEHLDQSVRGGTQTDGPLFSRIEPELRALREAIVRAVEGHVAQLPAIDLRHPTLAKARDRRIRFAGSWSVRLAGQGHHANHVHPQGWLSSAFYVALPDETERGGGEAGWLTLGQPQMGLGLDLAPVRTIEPKPGQLVLFPSTMWHGTTPFAHGERLTVAFDVAQPR